MWDVLPAADIVTQDFGCVPNLSEWWAPWCPSHRYHSGLDLGSSHGGNSICRSPVYATRAGIVVRVGYPNGLGDQAVFLHLDQGGWLIYGHLDAALVLPKEEIAVGQEIGLLGSRGLSTACHLHLEYRTDGPNQGVANAAAGVANPARFLYADGRMTPQEQQQFQDMRSQLDGLLGEFNSPAGRIPKLEAAVKALPSGGASGTVPDHHHETGEPVIP